MTTIITALLIASLAGLLAAAAVGIASAIASAGRRAPAMVSGTSVATPPAGSSRVAVAGLLLAAIALTGAAVLRAAAVGHAPWSNLHEFSIAFAAVLLVGYVIVLRSHPVEGLAPLVALLAAGLVGIALGLDDRVDPLVPALQQPLLLTIHVGSAAIAYAVSGLAFVAAVAEIGQRAARDRIPALPSADVARAVGHRSVLVAFPILTIAIVLGSVWANLAWRSYWSNDPKELAAAATWLVFGAYLHVAGRTDRWGRLAPWLIVLGFAGVLFTYIGAGLFIVGEHSYGAP